MNVKFINNDIVAQNYYEIVLQKKSCTILISKFKKYVHKICEHLKFEKIALSRFLI